MSVTSSSTPKVHIPGLYPQRGKPRVLGAFESFGISALAPAMAVVFTNPFDTAKVRLQLQGERLKQVAKGGASGANAAQVVYRNSFDAMYKIAVNEGVRGLQKGLTPAIFREGSKNLFRIGMFDPIMHIIHDPSQGKAPGWKRMVAGSICGVMGAVSCNPFELVKTRLQSSTKGNIAVGHQYQYTGMWDAMRSIYKADGVKGLYRGSVLSMGRSVFGSGSNLAAYSMLKDALLENGWKDNAWLDMVCGMSSGIVSCIAMNPIDVTRTRYYNQPYENGKGVLYLNGLDAIKKIAKNEGFSAFYKGFVTHFLRIGPHFCLTFVFLGILRRGLSDFYGYLDMRDSFHAFDTDGNGVLDQEEVKEALHHIVPTPSATADDDYEKMIDFYTVRILEMADADQNHVITPEEFPAMVEEVTKIYGERQRR
ncbi:hypothetical protein HDU85_004808 [Gaertneriomyces sp. JEL0708]|nr:hypothetical protein HDU85_004808 [Gaertneriomyces sp. JEL0708]